MDFPLIDDYMPRYNYDKLSKKKANKKKFQTCN